MNNIKSYRDLNVWKESHEVVLDIYRITSQFPKEELYGLTSQLRRSSVSIPANIVEGKGRNTTKDYLRFLYIAQGSLEETKYLIELSYDLSYLKKDIYCKIYSNLDTIGRMFSGLIQSLANFVKEPEENYFKSEKGSTS